MLKRWIFQAVVAAVAMIGSATAAKADFIVDTFDVPAPPHIYNISTVGGSASFTDSISPGLITRDTTVTLLSGPNAFAANGQLGDLAGSKMFQMNTAANSTAYASLKYSYSTPQNLSIPGTSVIFTFTFADLNTPFSVKITDANSASAIQSTIATAGPGVYAIPMTGFGGIDLTQVSSIELVLNQDLTKPVPASTAVTSADLTLTDVRISVPYVPAPPAIVLMLAAAPALGLYRAVRRRNSNVTV